MGLVLPLKVDERTFPGLIEELTNLDTFSKNPDALQTSITCCNSPLIAWSLLSSKLYSDVSLLTAPTQAVPDPSQIHYSTVGVDLRILGGQTSAVAASQ